jgi:hypothetical protein
MPVSPEECAKNLTAQDDLLLAAMQKQADEYLRKEYHGQGKINVYLKEWGNSRVRQKFAESYRDAGWKSVTFSHEQRDGWWLTLEA